MFVAENPCLVRVLVIAVFSVSERLTFAKKIRGRVEMGIKEKKCKVTIF